MIRFIGISVLTIVFAFLLIAGPWYLRTPQPIGYRAQLDFMKDSAVYGYYDMTRNSNEMEFQYWLPLANDGNSLAQIKIAELLFIKGVDDARAYQKAVALLTRAANKGVPEAQNALGVAYRNGLGIPEDKLKAFKWFTLASRQGVGLAQRNLETLVPELSVEERKAAMDQVDLWVVKYMDKIQ